MNAPSPRTVSPSGSVMAVSPVQPLNALLPISVTVFGMAMPVSPSEPKNAQLPIPVTGRPPSVSGITALPPAPLYFVTVTLPCPSLTVKAKSPSVCASSALTVSTGRIRDTEAFCGTAPNVSAAAARTLRICFCDCFIFKPPFSWHGDCPAILYYTRIPEICQVNFVHFGRKQKTACI